MKCKEFEMLMPEYWEGQLNELKRYHVEQHARQCLMCRHEFSVWEESEKLIQNSTVDFKADSLQFNISQDVMSRIYAENPWATPLSKRAMLLSERVRIWMTGISAALFIVFMASFFFSTTMPDASQVYGEDIFSKKYQLVGIQTVGTVKEASASSEVKNPFYGAVASIGEPAVIPDTKGLPGKAYILALSLFGLAVTVITASWLSRIRGT